ncbi:hypothetical protein EDI_339350 [Entamoeba dispar SAW760]|uniref:UDENN domain-containing protein n=1 Tax=Entamoeba dispar (strain ATCC PRA-260 / SAW760) TaxID=370354 RepID=B0EDV2_ENTDS|nr:uncharacterized protein EDI_339350 [Entamoeba dispar SAW760]EDR27291.1 hypothetical protein EDI_339350 [Entamoeba dispar SAW760]|eukprot:EDR27291.1 hypothetical protein EDI_339350 [Entamoeba dispar SAW760]
MNNTNTYFSKEEFERARGRREAFSKLEYNQKDETRKLVEQFLIIGATSSEDCEAKILYRYPDIDIENFEYKIISLYCFPEGCKTQKKEAISTEDLFQIEKSIKEGCINVSNFFSLKMASPKNGVERNGLCFSIKRIEIDKQKPLIYYEDEIVYMIVSTSSRYLLLIEFIEALIMNERNINWFKTNNITKKTFESYFKQFFNLPENYQQTVNLSWNKNLLENIECPLGCCLFIRVIPVEDLIILLSALVLQRKLLIKSKNRCILSGALSFLTQAVKPFSYDSPIISVLINDLFDLIDSPTPLLIGCNSLPNEIPENSILYDIDDKFMQKFTDDFILLPNANEIASSIEDIRKPLKNCKNHPTHFCLKEHSRYIQWALQKIQIEFRLMVDNFDDYIETLKEPGKPQISLFRKKDFIEEAEPKYLPFLKEFCETQMFESFINEKLDAYDYGK